ncbi:MAG: hypothetical protein ACYTGC_13200 [Planctomycetota bacterium]|jgi:hypothetical protein
MALARLGILARAAAALLGLALLVPTLFIQVPLGEPGIDPGVVLALILAAAPCGLLFYFARTGVWYWGAALFLPLLDLVQSQAVVGSLVLFPHSRAAHIAITVLASWLFICGVHLVSPSRHRRRSAA